MLSELYDFVAHVFIYLFSEYLLSFHFKNLQTEEREL